MSAAAERDAFLAAEQDAWRGWGLATRALPAPPERESGLTLWLVARKDAGETIGRSGFALVEGTGPDVEIAYHSAKRAWGHGYATEAAVAWLERGFAELGLENVIAICYPENTASLRVMEKAGMTLDGEGDCCGIRMKRYVAARGTWRRPGSS